MKPVKFSELRGKTLVSAKVAKNNTTLTFITTESERYRLYHNQECGERVTLEEVVGDIEDLIGSPLIQAEETQSRRNRGPKPAGFHEDSWKWTFYKMATIKGSVTLRWFGGSNGYYSEKVDISKQKMRPQRSGS